MQSGTITFQKSRTSGSYTEGKIEWTSVANNGTNTSSVTVKLYVKKGLHGGALTLPTAGLWSYRLTVDDNETIGTVHLSVLDWTLVCTRTISNVSHSSDGTKSITISGSITAPYGTSFEGHASTGSSTAMLDTIPRASSMDVVSCATKYFTGKMTYKYKPQSAGFYNRCKISLELNGTSQEVKTIDIGKKAASVQTGTVTLTEAELSNIYTKLPETDNGKIRFALYTYSDSGYSTQVGKEDYKELTLYIPEDETTKPTVSVKFEPVHNFPDNYELFDGLYVMGKTKVLATFSDAAGKYGATIVSCQLAVNGKSYGEPYLSEYLAKEGNTTVYGVVTDSRGFSNRYPMEVQVLYHSNPKLLPASDESEVVAVRCNSNGEPSDSGTYLKIKAKRSYCPVKVGEEQNNYCEIRFQYKAETDENFPEAWTTILAWDATENEIETAALLGGALEKTTSYAVKVRAFDSTGESDGTTIHIPTEAVHTHRTKNGIGFGTYCKGENLMAVGWDAQFNGNVKIGERTLAEYIRYVLETGG